MLESNTSVSTNAGSSRLGLEVSPYCSASVAISSWKRFIVMLLACSPSVCASAAVCPRASAARVTTRCAVCAWVSACLVCVVSCSSICSAASFTNVPGPSTTFTVFAFASCPHGPFGPPSAPNAFVGTLPDRHPSNPTSLSMSELSSSCCRLPLTSTSTGSSPKLL